MKKMLAVSALVMTPLLAACGDDGPNATPSDAIEVTAKDFEFGPAEWNVIAGQFTLTFHNEGNVEHEWAILHAGVEITSEDKFNDEIVMAELEKQPAGTTTTETFNITEPGEYQVICALEGHLNAGMIGTLIVHAA